MIKDRPIVKRAEFREKLYKNRFVLPNLLTVGNMFCGYTVKGTSNQITNCIQCCCNNTCNPKITCFQIDWNK